MSALNALVFDPVVSRALGAALAIVLLAGAWQKLRDPVVFEAAIENYGLLPAGGAAVLARVLPLVEAAAGVLILLAETAPYGALLAVVLLAVVSAAVAINLWRGRSEIDCGCGGLSQQTLSWGLVLRNGILAAAALLAGQGDIGRDLVWMDYFTVLGAVLALIGLYVSVNQLMANAPRALATRH